MGTLWMTWVYPGQVAAARNAILKRGSGSSKGSQCMIADLAGALARGRIGFRHSPPAPRQAQQALAQPADQLEGEEGVQRATAAQVKLADVSLAAPSNSPRPSWHCRVPGLDLYIGLTLGIGTT